MDEENVEIGGEMSRNQLQTVAMTAIYDMLTYVSMGSSVDVQGIVSALFDGKPYSECDYFVKACLVMAIKEHDSLISLLNGYMNHWTFDRLNRVEQAILLLSCVHYLYVDPTVAKGVVIDIAIKLAKTYLSDKDYRFVNAILDKALPAR